MGPLSQNCLLIIYLHCSFSFSVIRLLKGPNVLVEFTFMTHFLITLRKLNLLKFDFHKSIRVERKPALDVEVRECWDCITSNVGMLIDLRNAKLMKRFKI